MVCGIFCRIWRTWLAENNYEEDYHFITQNVYACIELNAHSLLSIAHGVALRKLPLESLRVWLTGSQCCEQLFRLLRSMTGTFSTIVNFSLKEMLNRINKANFISSVECCDEIVFPRVKRRLLQLGEETEETFSTISIEEITSCVHAAKEKAKSVTRKYGMAIDSYADDDLMRDTVTILDLDLFSADDDVVSCTDTEGDGGNLDRINDANVSSEEAILIKEDINRLRKIHGSDIEVPAYVLYVGPDRTTQKIYAISKKQNKRYVSLFVK